MKTANGTATLEEMLTVFYKASYFFTLRSDNHTTWCLPELVKKSCPHKNLQTGICSSIIHDSQNLEEIKISFS